MNLNLLGLGLQGRSPNVSAQRRLNLYLELHAEDRDKTSVSAHGTPGLTLFYDFGSTPIRGMHGLGDYIYACHRGLFFRISNAGIAEPKGALLSTTGQIDIADNGAEIMVVDGTYGYIYDIAADTFTQISAEGFPGADTVTFLDGYFIVNRPSTGQFFHSALYDGTTWVALDYATAESNPDNLVAVLAERSLLHLFSDYSHEVWANTGALDFPFARMQGAAVEWGLAARWSVVKFDDSLCWLARNRLGQVSVVRSSGVDIQRVSNSDLDYLFSTYSSVSDATAYGFQFNSHPMYQISFPSESRSWLFDGKTGAWSVLESYGITRHRGETQTSFLNEIMIGDFDNGRIYKLRGDALTDNSECIPREIVSPHSFGAEYNNFFMSELRLDLETGVGLAGGQGSDPQCMLSISRDGGHSFGTEKWVSAGKIGQYRHRARWRRLGRARDVVFKIRITDPIKVVILGASLLVEPGTA